MLLHKFLRVEAEQTQVIFEEAETQAWWYIWDQKQIKVQSHTLYMVADMLEYTRQVRYYDLIFNS